MKNKILKIVAWLIGVIIIVLVFLYLVGAYESDVNNYFYQKRQEKALAELRVEYLRIENLQKNDTYGGKTPEETLDLYIKALKASDIELASKYYEISVENPEMQTQNLEDLKNMIKRDGNLNLFIKEVENIRNLGVKKIFSEGNVSFVYSFVNDKEIRATSTVSNEEIITIIPEGANLKVGNALGLNLYTNVWKIIQ